MHFRDREDVAWQLAERLAPYLGQRPLVLGLPRGGVPMAAVIAERLDADLDVMLVHKLRAAFQPELALGSIDEAGHVYLTPFAAELGVDERELGDEAQFQLGALRNRRARYTSGAPRVGMTDKTVILVDDGLATGSTAIAAVRSARAQGATRVVVAAGVAPAATVTRMQSEADEVVCLYAPEDFDAVSQFFGDFSEVSDDEVVRILARRGVGARVEARGLPPQARTP